MKTFSSALLGGVAMVALATVGSPAQAFDKVDWRWDLDIVETITKDITIEVDFDPTGVVNVEAIQMFVGDSTATAYADDVENKPHLDVEDRTYDFTATGQARGSLDVTGTAEGFVDIDQGHWTSGCDLEGACLGAGNEDNRIGVVGIAGQPDGESITENGVPGSFGSEDPLTVEGTAAGTMNVRVAGSITVPVPESLNALTQLPLLENTATALANNMNIDSDTMVEAHIGQYAFDAGGESSNGNLRVADALADYYVDQQSGNQHNTTQEIMEVLTAAAITGLISPSTVSADATVNNIDNLQIDNSATALANNLSINLEAATDDDRIVLGDLTQFAYANVSANASMTDVYVKNYRNLGQLDSALFSNVATSIGNNLSINVSGINVETPGGENGGGGGGSE